MKKIYLLFLLAGMISFTSCGKEEQIPQEQAIEVVEMPFEHIAPVTKGFGEYQPNFKPFTIEICNNYAAAGTLGFHIDFKQGSDPTYSFGAQIKPYNATIWNYWMWAGNWTIVVENQVDTYEKTIKIVNGATMRLELNAAGQWVEDVRLF